ncbi:MAG: DUF3426 domain-containing protein [Methylotenera sp.]|nr:DUF3426 domain-containing protein [Methylotenera sp.]MSP99754.1 DUF3426 domain-containing protein [Methylotenera sp.]
MSAVTSCPSCQTQFIVTEEQFNQHAGQVRCGYCLQVFNARNELVGSNAQIEVNLDAIDDLAATAGTDYIGSDTFTKGRQFSYFNDLVNRSKPSSTRTTWFMGLLALMLVFTSIVQSVYFFRSEIAIYYPSAKTYLVNACVKFSCNINLPKQIDLIVIDDSAIQEDENYQGLIHLSSTLINQAPFSQAYPNIELTLTDIEDTPKLRRTFKPNEYLADHAAIVKGLAAGEEVKVKLAITAQDITVAGYRVFLSY